MGTPIRNLLVIGFLSLLLMTCSKWKLDPVSLLPQVTTSANNQPGTTSAAVSCEVGNLGTDALKEFGIVFSSSNNTPRLDNGAQKQLASGSSPATVTLSGLQPNTTYYYRSYVTNDKGLTGYGDVKTLKTGEPDPIAETLDVVGTPASTSAQVQCRVSNAGSVTLQEYGIIYSTNNAPTLQNGTKVKATGTGGATTVTLSGLQPSTTYYYLAYATNTVGLTRYGTAKSFITAKLIRPVVAVSGTITTNTTWTAGNIYLLQGFVDVDNNATLTIQPGTIIKGGGLITDPSGQGRSGTLIIRPGAKIDARGTATAPIVFTSNQPAGSRKYGDWGGVVLIGKAPTNQPGSSLFEGGIPGTSGTYNELADNSGILQYVRIEFGGAALMPNFEINGLTMYGVGSGTTIDHIQVSYGGDDAFEWLGGTVNMKYLIAYRNFDDDWDTDWGFTGKVQYGVSLRDPNVADQSGSNGFESDNFNNGSPATGPNAGLPLTAPVFANFSNFVFSATPSNANTSGGSGAYQAGMHLRRNTSISIFNSLVVGYPEGLRLDAPTGITGTSTYENAANGGLQLRGIILVNDEIPNSTTVVRGAGTITDAQAQIFFNTAVFKNQIIPLSGIAALLLNADNFKLGAPNFLPGAASLLLTSGTVWDGKGADAFFTKETFIGAFGTTDWTKGWANWDPQNTIYE